MPSRPLVSIVIPVYNGADYLREAIDSALAQTYPDVEAIVVDDGSDDGGATDRAARAYGDRIRYVRKENGGVASALNRGIREMRGDCFCWLSHDDVYLPRSVEARVAALARSRRDAVPYGDYELIDAAGRTLEAVRTGWMRERDFRLALVLDIPVNGCTVLVPRALLDAAGPAPFDESLRFTQDYDLWFRLAAMHPFVHVPEVLIRSRVHPGQGTRAMPEACLAEGNASFVRQMEALSRERSGDSGPPSSFFLRAAVRLKRRGYVDASRRALDLWLDAARPGGAAASLARAYCDACTRLPMMKGYGLYRKVRAALG